MNPRTIGLVLAAILFAGGTVYVANMWLDSQRRTVEPAPAPQVERYERSILVAKADLPTGTFLRPEHLRWQAWPDAALAKSYIVKAESSGAADRQIQAFSGAVVRKGISVGEPVTDGRVVKPGERGFLAAVLHPHMRAISVQVSATTGAAGFIFPGDRVDLLLTHTVRQGETSRRASETLLTNIRVLAVDQRTNDQENKAAVAKTVTLEVTPKHVEMVNVARTLGNLSLSLRALAREEDPLAAISAEAENDKIAKDDKSEPQPPAGTAKAEKADAGSAKTGAKDKTTKDSAQKSVQVEEPVEPHRSRSHTWDSQVSRLLGRGGPSVTVLRGSSVQTQEVKRGKAQFGPGTQLLEQQRDGLKNLEEIGN